MFLREKRSARRSRYLYAGGGHLTDELECCYVRVRVPGDVTTEADRRICGMHLCHTYIYFPIRERIHSRWHRGGATQSLR
ncbi:hypothetical protein EV363DRAFT_1262818 [Boletus edulis]|nr:hypothetical protein EV363DRAFT_1262818 [Boletus edulis]